MGWCYDVWKVERFDEILDVDYYIVYVQLVRCKVYFGEYFIE